MIFADSGFFIALLNPTDAIHRRALLWTTSVHDRLVSTEYCLVEVFNSLSDVPLRRRSAQFQPLLEQLRCQVSPASPELLNPGITLHQSRPDKEWSLTDCISFELMRRRQITQALAHDHHFEQAGFDALLRRDPS